MASLNLSLNGPSIKSSYTGVVNSAPPPGSSATWGQWALFTVQAPLMNAFQDSGAKESILKVETTGDGDLADLVEEFNEGRIQFAFVKVKDPNSGLPKSILIAWCGGGVPERTKGYFANYSAAVAKTLHGYHIQITARSDSDLTPETILQKVGNASGAKYGGGSTVSAAAPPPVAKKPVFTPTTTSTASSAFNPLIAARSRTLANKDDDGWGDAPQVTKTELERVESAYKPTKVNMAELLKNKDESRSSDGPGSGYQAEVIGGGYKPVGKIDIAALRARANYKEDDRPTLIKGAYEPVGKVDIAAIRARSQRPAEPEPEEAPASRSLADRSAAFTQSERLTELPKPKVAKKFGGSSAFTGTKAPTPGGMGFGAPAAAPAPAPGGPNRSFAASAGKTPAQLWAEKKAAQGGAVGSTVSPPITSPVTAQKSGGEWKSGYSGKSWATVQTTNFGRGGVETNRTGATDDSNPEPPISPAGGVSAIRDRFKDAAPISAAPSRAIPSHPAEEDYAPPPPAGSRPSGGFALPGLPSRPAVQPDEEEEEAPPAIPSRDYEEPEPEPESPVRIAVPVAREPSPEPEPPAPVRPIEPEPVHHEEEVPPAPAGGAGGKRAIVQFDYEKAEDNELELREGEYVTNIDMVDEDWWMGTNAHGESGLFPSNYVELVEDGAAPAAVPPPPAPAPAAEPEPAPAAPAGGSGATATAQFDYDAAEDNELSFPEGATIHNLEFPDDDWWFGHYNGASGLFPANYVQLDS